MVFKGSCHCGRLRIEVDVDDPGTAALVCNCSICGRRGSLLWFVPRQALRLAMPDAEAATYTFGRAVIGHRFCPRCGIHVWGEGSDPQGRAMAAINIRCLEGLDLDAVPLERFDGRALPGG